MVLLLRELYFSKDPEGVEHFPGEGPTFSRGVLMLISIKTHIACYFPGDRSGPLHPLDPNMPALLVYVQYKRRKTYVSSPI